MGLRDIKNNPRTSEANIIPCPSCHYHKCHIHDHYPRKGTHLTAQKEIILVPVYRCPRCGKTHGVLPNLLPPICRWFWEDILRIAPRLSAGESVYSIAKAIRVSLAALRNLKAWISRAGPTILALTREQALWDALPQPTPPTCAAAALTLAYRFSSWPAFAHSFSRVFYPKRFPLCPSHVNLTG